MTSRLLRRSGVAICLVAEQLGFKPDLIIQVGIGLNHEETAVFKEVWPDVALIGLEPHPGIVESIKTKYPGVIIPCAAGRSSGIVTLNSKPRHRDGSSICKHMHQDGQPIEVPVTSLDTDEMIQHLVEIHSNILLWLDCEGTELDALAGAQHLLDKVAWVNVELTGRPHAEGWCDQTAVHDFLLSAGFFRQWVHTQRIGCGQNDGIYVRRDWFNPQLCCCPCEIKRFRGTS